MCQLLGMNCNVPTDIMFSFSGFAQRACEHADGFGIAFFEGRGVRCFVDAQPANASPVADLIKAYPIRSTDVIAHIRKATVGRVALENCHPFTRELWGRYWVFAHNGDLKGYEPRLHGAFSPVGDTDSERAFCWLLQEMDKSHASLPSPHELTRTLNELVPQIARHGTFNFILSNGEALWAHCTTKLHYLIRQFPFAEARLQDADVTVDFAQVASHQDRVALIATEPLTSNEPWVAFEAGQLKVFADGQDITPA
jgi:predicted glutamine amidotransferase